MEALLPDDLKMFHCRVCSGIQLWYSALIFNSGICPDEYRLRAGFKIRSKGHNNINTTLIIVKNSAAIRQSVSVRAQTIKWFRLFPTGEEFPSNLIWFSSRVRYIPHAGEGANKISGYELAADITMIYYSTYNPTSRSDRATGYGAVP